MKGSFWGFRCLRYEIQGGSELGIHFGGFGEVVLGLACRRLGG